MKGFRAGDRCSFLARIDKRMLLQTLGEKIHDHRCLRLVEQLFAAGPLEKYPSGQLAGGLSYGRHGFGAEAGGVIPSPTVTLTGAVRGLD
jgi:hypothetical protein